MRSDAGKQPRKGAKESKTSPRTEEELAGRKHVKMAATLAALTSQCGGPLHPLWPPRIESWVVPLLVLHLCGILLHSPKKKRRAMPDVTRAALTVSLEKRTCGLLCLPFFCHFELEASCEGPSGSVIPDDPVCLSEQWIRVGASLGAAVMSTFFKSQLSTVHRVFYKLGRRMPYA